MIVIKVNYTTDQPIIKVNYDDAPIYISTSVDATYINVDYGTGGGGGGGAIWGDIIGTLSDQLDLQAALDAKVPYTGATANVDLGEYELKAGQIELDQSPTGTAGVAVTRWNDIIGSTETTLKGGNVVLKNGVDLVARIVNKVTPNTTLTKAAYQAVKVSGAQGQRLAVALAQANNDNNSADTLGLVIETIPTNQEGFIMTVGNLEGINTTGSLQGETWSDGDVLYLSPTTPGAITNVKPNGSTGHIVVIGYVEYAHQNNGKIYVKIMNGWELSELHDTFISSPANNDALIYESATSLWKNKSIATALGYTPGTVSSVALSVPTGLVITSGSPITTSGTIAVGLQSGYSIPTTIKQSNWDDAYTFVSAFPSQTGNSGKYLTTDGSTLSWGTVSTANIYNSDGTLTGNRTITSGGFGLTFTGSNTASSAIARGLNLTHTLVAAANNDVLVGLDINPTFTNGAFTGVANVGLRVEGHYIGRGGANEASNLAIGFQALYKNTATGGANSVAVGYRALASNTAGYFNTAIGAYALESVTTTTSNTAIGTASQRYGTGGGNTSVGRSSLANTSFSGSSNTAIGETAALNNTSGASNTALGSEALYNNTIGSNNVAIGRRASMFISGGSVANTISNNSIYIGYDTRALADNQTNQIVIGYNSTGLGSNTTVIGNSSTTDTAIYGRMLVNYGTPVIGTYALDVNGTGRFKVSSVGTTTPLRIENGSSGSNVNLELVGGPLASTAASVILQGTDLGGWAQALTLKIYDGTAGGSGSMLDRYVFAKDYFNLLSVAQIKQTGNNAIDNIWVATGTDALNQISGISFNFYKKSAIYHLITTSNTWGVGDLIFAVNNTISSQFVSSSDERMRLTRSGNLLIGTSTDVSSSILTLSSTTKGFLPPRMTAAQKTAISTPATGLVIYQTDSTEGLYQYKSTGWEAIGGGGGTPAGSNTQIQYNNSGAFGASAGLTYNDSTGVMTLSKNQNGLTNLEISNSFNSASTQSSLSLKTSGASFGIGKYGQFTTPYKIYGFYDCVFYNDSNGGDFSFLNENATGKIKFAMGGSSTAQATLFSTGNFIIGGTTDAGYKLDVQGTARVTGLASLSGGINSFQAPILAYDGGATNDRAGLGISSSTLNVFGPANILLGVRKDQSNLTTSNANIWLSETQTKVNTSFDAASYKPIFATESISSAITASFGSGRFHNSYNAAGTTYTQYPILSITRAGESGVGYDMSASFGIRRRVVGGNTPKTVLDINVGETAINGYPDTTIMSITGTGVSINNTTINASAILSLTSNTKGFLPPTMTETQKNAISTPATGLVIYQTDGTEGLYQYKSTGWSQVAGTGGGGGISRSVNVISTTTTAGASASTDYVYLISGTTTLTLPTAVGNTNRYTLKNVGTNTVTINTTSSQTIDGSTSITMAVRYTALDVISDGTNWNII